MNVLEKTVGEVLLINFCVFRRKISAFDVNINFHNLRQFFSCIAIDGSLTPRGGT